MYVSVGAGLKTSGKPTGGGTVIMSFFIVVIVVGSVNCVENTVMRRIINEYHVENIVRNSVHLSSEMWMRHFEMVFLHKQLFVFHMLSSSLGSLSTSSVER